ncbi:uncharacterized protein LTR77_000120 [Saxophila tyrrhenica]|uniref:Uncharacterized protein n=1 Tax=Saxophila tyrrhenica TaxID=1690608 RepID=A0AAV9PPL0_9PEZI|nr:hypothetical protein LTR77_000120 [Saxophila tyrrhenica]
MATQSSTGSSGAREHGASNSDASCDVGDGRRVHFAPLAVNQNQKRNNLETTKPSPGWIERRKLNYRLSKAAKDVDTDSVIVQLRDGADVDYADDDVWTAFRYFVNAGRAEGVQMLIEAGSDVNACATQSNKDSPFPNGHPIFPLCLAAYVGAAEVMPALVMAPGIRLEQETKDAWTAIIYAVNSGHTECVKVLINAGADVNHEFSNTSPLYLAVEKNYPDIVRALLSAPTIDLEQSNRVSRREVSMRGHHEIVKLLLDRGHKINAARATPPCIWPQRKDEHQWCAYYYQHQMLTYTLEANGVGQFYIVQSTLVTRRHLL